MVLLPDLIYSMDIAPAHGGAMRKTRRILRGGAQGCEA